MVATPFGGEFNRFDRDGDYVEGPIQIIEVSQPKGAIIEFLNAEFGGHIAGLRLNGNSLEFEDVANGIGNWIPLSALTGQIGDIHHVFATPGQTVFPLPFSYTVGGNVLQVFIGGIRMPGTTFLPTPVYVETNPNTVTFNAVPPFTPFVGGELLIFYVAGRPIVADTYLVKGDAADGNPQALDGKLAVSAPLTMTPSGSPGDTVQNLAAPTVYHPGNLPPQDPPLSNATPLVESGAGSAGAGTDASRWNHVHPEAAAKPPLSSDTPLVESGAGSAGVSTDCSRKDHVHPEAAAKPPLSNDVPLVESGAGSAGVSTDCSRKDHVHPLGPAGNPAVDELKNATVVNSSSFLQNGTAGPTRYYINATAVQAHRWHWASCWAVSAVISGGICRVDHFMHYLSQRDAGSVLIATVHQLALDVTTSGAGNHTIYHKTYRADET
jgi:hypothetical protein